MVQQHFMLFNPFTVAENIVIGYEPKKNGIFFDRSQANKIVSDLSEKYGLDINPLRIVEDCPVGIQQRVEILKVLDQKANIIIFDEPSAVLTPQEVRDLLQTIKKLAKLGKSIILITHKLQEVMDVADRVVIMRGGKVVGEMDIAEATIEKMSYMMVGHYIEERKIEQQVDGDTILSVENLKLNTVSGKHILDDFSINVKSGEIVGIAGVSGNGQSELIRCIMGMTPVTSGTIELCGKYITGKSVQEIRNAGCACIPDDRYKYGCSKDASLIETALMGNQRKEKYSKRGIFLVKAIKKFASHLLKKFDVRYSSCKQKSGELSGGNLQKLIVAREMAHESRLLIAAEPTRGIDIGAMEFIHDRLLEKRKKGDGVLLVSSELSEIISLSDRIYVIYSGKVAGEFTREEADSEKLGLLMMGGSLKSEG